MEAKNAVRIQISAAIITYCLVAIVHHDMQLKRFADSKHFIDGQNPPKRSI